MITIIIAFIIFCILSLFIYIDIHLVIGICSILFGTNILFYISTFLIFGAQFAYAIDLMKGGK